MGAHFASDGCARVGVLGLAACFGGFLYGCNAVDGEALGSVFGDLETTEDSAHHAAGMDGGTEDAGGDAPIDRAGAAPPSDDACATGACWWSGETATCGAVGVPTADMAPGVKPDGSDQDVAPIYLGWSKLWLGESPRTGSLDDHSAQEVAEAWAGFGFDLDGTCTNATDCDAAPEGVVSCKSATAELPFDGDACRDNTYARFHPLVAQSPALGAVYGLTEAAFNCSLHRGDYSPIIRISGYNGELDDGEVRVDYYHSPGIVTPPDFWQCPAESFASERSRWRASDEWYVNKANLTDDITTAGEWPGSKWSATTAYVREGYLVSLSEAFPLDLSGDGAPFQGWSVRVTGAVLVGKLVKQQDGTWSLQQGLVGGRIHGDDVFAAWNQLGVCPDETPGSLFDRIQEFTLQGLDILADGSVDPDAECDAMSFGAGFEARQITPGPSMETTPRVNCCDPDNLRAPSCPGTCDDGRVTGGETCDTAIAAGEEGACPTECGAADGCTAQVLTGEDCQTECVEMTITELQGDDGCCPEPGADDSDCSTLCGNGELDPGETCDPLDSCPTEGTCVAPKACTRANLTGDPNACTSECELSDMTECRNGDQCCPSGCNSMSDDDCEPPELCGNGTLEFPELCDGDCPTECEDGDRCTTVELLGEPENCSSVCLVTRRIRRCLDGDGCCPVSCSGDNDNDCPAQGAPDAGQVVNDPV